MYHVHLEEELQLLAGSGTGEDLNGLIPHVQSFDTGLLSLSQGWTAIDIVESAIAQITAAKEVAPSFIILHPLDWWTKMRLRKDSQGRYLLGDALTGVGIAATGGTLANTSALLEQ